jgi:hypothetical protein
MTAVDEFLTWMAKNAAGLQEREEQRQRNIQGAVIRAIAPMLRRGLAFDEACDSLSRRFYLLETNGVVTTKKAVNKALRAIGWRSANTRGGDA